MDNTKYWNSSYNRQDRPSWTKYGLPELYRDFLTLHRNSQLRGKHLDIGSGDGTKTLAMARDGLDVIGIDNSEEGITKARQLKDKSNHVTCTFLQADALSIPLPDASASSASDFLMSTHFDLKDWMQYKQELLRVLSPGALFLGLFFSINDKHFHGIVIDPEKPIYKYTQRLVNKQLEPDYKKYKHYEGMINHHFHLRDLEAEFSPFFDIINLVEVVHPLYPHRKLLNLLAKKRRRL